MQAPACLAEGNGIEADCDSDTDSDDDDDSSAVRVVGGAAAHASDQLQTTATKSVRRTSGVRSPTPSEAGLAQVSSCSSSSSASSSRSSSGSVEHRLPVEHETASAGGSVRAPIRPPPRIDSLLPGSAAARAAASISAAIPKPNGSNHSPAVRHLRPPRSASNHGIQSFNSSANSAAGSRNCGGSRSVAGFRSTAVPPATSAAAATPSRRSSSDSRNGVASTSSACNGSGSNGSNGSNGSSHCSTQSMPTTNWRSTGWRRVSSASTSPAHQTVSVSRGKLSFVHSCGWQFNTNAF